MQLAMEGGISALALLLVFPTLVDRSCRPGNTAAKSAPRRALAMAMAAATLILMLSSLVDYPLRTPLLSSLFAIACVELIRSKRRAGAQQQS